jgi:hypothetical protein
VHIALNSARRFALSALGPLHLTPGQHALAFDALGEPSPSPPPDRRRLSVRLHDWRWR